MKSIAILYDDSKEILSLLQEGVLKAEKPYFVKIYTADMDKTQAVCTAKEIKGLFKNAILLGCSTSGVIYNGEQYQKTLIIFEEFKKTSIKAAIFKWENKTAKEVAQDVNSIAEKENTRLMHLFFGNHYYDVHGFVDEFNKINTSTKIVGGIAGDILEKDIVGYVFTEEEVVENAVAVGAYTGEISVFNEVNIAHEPISPKYELTEIVGCNWVSVNGVEANEWIRQQLGIDTLKEYTDWQLIADNDVMVRFPMVLEGHNGASRFLKYDNSTKCVTQYFSSIPVGTQFRIGYVSPSECVKESLRISGEIREHPIESLFSYSCIFRKMYLNNCAKWELSPYKQFGIHGAFMMGEISNVDGTNQFLNGSCCILGLAENKNYIRPDTDVFEELQKINDDTKDLLNMVLKKQSENVNKYNEELLDKLISQQQYSTDHIYTDFNTGMDNYLKYKKDVKALEFDKICMIKIQNAEELVTHVGQEEYIGIVKSAIRQFKRGIERFIDVDLLSYYVFSDNTFLISANMQVSNELFLQITNKLYEKFRFIKYEKLHEVLVNRMVCVVNQESSKLIDIALNAFQANKNLHMPYLVCDSAQHEFAVQDEFNIIGVINRALDNDGIVPYFQGIFDNIEKKIIKYEALMRIEDVDGKVYIPGDFMAIAKKYSLYPHLSKIIINKVFDMFEGRNETVSVNFSAYDISSKEIRDMVFGRLEKMQDPSNFVLEILEDEEFRDTQMLVDFAKRAKDAGVKIAIDDFGSGYSNLLEIASISPDYIKVDGGIIRNLQESEQSRKILDIIVFLGEHFDTEIVAEFVENEEIQAQVANKHIRYSQGYYFARPLPFEKLELT